MERLGEDEVISIFEKLSEQDDKKSFSEVCKQFLKAACFHLMCLHNKCPDLLYDILPASPNLFRLKCDEPISNSHMKLISQSCPYLHSLDLWRHYSVEQVLDRQAHKFEFDDVGLCAVADACIHLIVVNLSGRLNFKEIGLGSLVGSCKNLRALHLEYCVNVTDKSLKVIGEATRLRDLYLRGCYLISDMGLEYLANGNLKYCLEDLFLDHCDRITDNGIIHMKKLARLKDLSLANCGSNITDYGIVALCDLPYLLALDLRELINLTDISLFEIASKCLTLFDIHLTGCKRVTRAGLHAFSGHQSLETFSLNRCYKISWEDVKSVASMCPKLNRLALDRGIKTPMAEVDCEEYYIGDKCYNIEWI